MLSDRKLSERHSAHLPMAVQRWRQRISDDTTTIPMSFNAVQEAGIRMMTKLGYDPLGKCWWGVELRKVVDSRRLWCFPRNIRPYLRPYPGFDSLEEWLRINRPKAGYQRLYNDGNPVLDVEFENPNEAFWFAMMSELSQ